MRSTADLSEAMLKCFCVSRMSCDGLVAVKHRNGRTYLIGRVFEKHLDSSDARESVSTACRNAENSMAGRMQTSLVNQCRRHGGSVQVTRDACPLFTFDRSSEMAIAIGRTPALSTWRWGSPLQPASVARKCRRAVHVRFVICHQLCIPTTFYFSRSLRERSRTHLEKRGESAQTAFAQCRIICPVSANGPRRCLNPTDNSPDAADAERLALEPLLLSAC